MTVLRASVARGGFLAVAESVNDPIHQPWAAHDTQVLIVAALGIGLVVTLIVWAKMHAFLALILSSLLVGVCSGLELTKVTASFEKGVGDVLGYVGVLIALGAMLGKLLGDSGGADEVVNTLLRGRPATLPWKMALIAAIVGIPMFFEVGLVLLVPVVMLAVHRVRGRALLLGIPALAGLSVLHGFVPPHPGPVAAIGILHADIGITLALGLLVAIPTVVVAGPLFGRLAARWVPIGAVVLNELVAAVKPTGGIGVVGVYMPQDPGAATDLAKQGKLAFDYGNFFFKGQSMGTGQCNTKHYNVALRDLITKNKAKPGFVVSHELDLTRATEGYEHFDQREDGWTKVVLHPAG
jgi:hypothetical protein